MSAANAFYNLGKTLSSAKRPQQGRRANGLWPHRFACPDKWLRNEPNKIEHEPTNGRSIYYGSGHLIPAFHGIERTSSWLLSLRLDALLGQHPAPAVLVFET
jgi:hypothetical protein